MEALSAAVAAGDQLLQELEGSAPGRSTPAPSMGRLQKVHYTHEALIELIIENPTWTQGQFAAKFGYTQGWLSNILASDAFKARMAARREEIIDPALKASIKERFEALVIASQTRLMGLLEKPDCPPQVALRALELGAKGLGAGGYAPPAQSQSERLAGLAERLVTLHTQVKERVINGQVLSKEVQPAGNEGGEVGEVQGLQPSPGDERGEIRTA